MKEEYKISRFFTTTLNAKLYKLYLTIIYSILFNQKYLWNALVTPVINNQTGPALPIKITKFQINKLQRITQLRFYHRNKSPNA